MPLLPVPGTLAPHVVWFGEMPLGMDEIYMAFRWLIFSLPLVLPGMFIRRLVCSRSETAWRAHRGTESRTKQVGNEFAEKYYGPASQVVPDLLKSC